MKSFIPSVFLGSLLAMAGAPGMAQTTMPAAGASAPAAVGVSPQTAAEATQKAVPRSDTGTVVRTSPTAAERASAAAASAGNATSNSITTPATTTGTTTGSDTTAATVRPARADRN